MPQIQVEVVPVEPPTLEDNHIKLENGVYSDINHTLNPKATCEKCDNLQINSTGNHLSKNAITHTQSSDHSSTILRNPLLKACAIDSYSKKIERGISKATENEEIVSQARNEVAQEFQNSNNETSSRGSPPLIETPVYTFTLPDLTIYPDDFREFLERDLVELSSLVSLEQAGRLNWWAESGTCQRLWPLATTGDGNCLLHAASLGMWGFHDRLLTLRKALHQFLSTSSVVNALYRRWMWQTSCWNAQLGLTLTEKEWNDEWECILKLASTEPRIPNAGYRRKSRLSVVSDDLYSDTAPSQVYESLEEFHVLALAHVLKRPVIVIADAFVKDVNGEALAPIPFGGIFLPLEFSPSECQRSPLLLTYDAGHFSALVNMEKNDDVSNLPAVIPLTDPFHQLLPIQFSIDPGENFIWGKDDLNPNITKKLVLYSNEQYGLLSEYLDLMYISLPDWFLEQISLNECNGSTSHFSDSAKVNNNLICDERISSCGGKNKTSKQLNSVAKQFGSFGKTVSKSLKKNLGTFGKLARNGSTRRRTLESPIRQIQSQSQLSNHGHDQILVAIIHAKRQPYQKEMVNNYLQEAYLRFTKNKKQRFERPENPSLHVEYRMCDLDLNGAKKCINPTCESFGTALTSYLCFKCFTTQKSQEENLKQNSFQNQNVAHYGAGKSQFFLSGDEKMHKDLSKIEKVCAKDLVKSDATLHLANSTFYDGIQYKNSAGCDLPENGKFLESKHADKKNQGKSISNLQFVRSFHTSTSDLNSSLNKDDCDKSFSEKNSDIKDEINSKFKEHVTGKICQKNGCQFFGSPETNNFCSKCYCKNIKLKQLTRSSQV